jgi:prepilin-type N-terminal cleavage/methylation domain-containing protein
MNYELRIKKTMEQWSNGAMEDGFTLIELMTVLFIVSIGLVGILGLIMYNIQTESVNRNRLIASQLAQEGLELTRNIRDDNWLAGNEWDKGIRDENCGGCSDFDIKFTIDYLGNKDFVTGIDDGRLQVNSDGYYVHNTALEDSHFKRVVTITSSSDASSSVSCRVQWTDRDRTYNYVADTVLYNWR